MRLLSLEAVSAEERDAMHRQGGKERAYWRASPRERRHVWKSPLLGPLPGCECVSVCTFYIILRYAAARRPLRWKLFKNSLTAAKSYQTAACSIRMNTPVISVVPKEFSRSLIANQKTAPSSMKFFVATACVLLLAAGISADPVKAATEEQSGAFAKCLESDSISCLQLTVRIS